MRFRDNFLAKKSFIVSEKAFIFFLLGSSLCVSAQSDSETKYKFGAKLGGSSCNVTGSWVKTHGNGGLNFGLWLQLKMSKH